MSTVRKQVPSGMHDDLVTWIYEQLYADEDCCLSELVETGSREFVTGGGYKFTLIVDWES